MKTTTTVSRMLAASALALGVATSALAAAPERPNCGANDRAPMEMQHRGGFADLRGIDLTPAQLTQLQSLRDAERKQMRDKGQALRDAHDALHKLTMSDAYTPSAAAELIAKISAAQSELVKLHADNANAIYKLLTPEQRTKLQQNELTGGPAGRNGRHSDGPGPRG